MITIKIKTNLVESKFSYNWVKINLDTRVDLDTGREKFTTLLDLTENLN